MTSNSPPHFPDTGQTGEGRRDQGDAVFEQASIWLARLREPESDVKAETDRLTAFQSWLGASPLHGQAFAEAGTGMLHDEGRRPDDKGGEEKACGALLRPALRGRLSSGHRIRLLCIF